MARRRGYSQTVIHNNEAYELDGLELTELEDRLQALQVDEYHPLHYKTVYDFLLELGYEVEPPNPKYCLTREEAEAKIQQPTVTADTRDKWSKEKILRERERLLNKERKLAELEDKLRQTVRDGKRSKVRQLDARRQRDFRIGEGYGNRPFRERLRLMAEDYFDVRFRNEVRYDSTPWHRTLGGAFLIAILGISFGTLMFLHELFLWVKTWFS